MFSGTNLLTSCHSASCLFSAVFGSRKVSKEIFSELDGTNPKSIFYRGQHEARIQDEGGSPGDHTPGRAGGPTPRLGGCSHPDAPWLTSSPIKYPDA